MLTVRDELQQLSSVVQGVRDEVSTLSRQVELRLSALETETHSSLRAIQGDLERLRGSMQQETLLRQRLTADLAGLSSLGDARTSRLDRLAGEVSALSGIHTGQSRLLEDRVTRLYGSLEELGTDLRTLMANVTE